VSVKKASPTRAAPERVTRAGGRGCRMGLLRERDSSPPAVQEKPKGIEGLRHDCERFGLQAGQTIKGKRGGESAHEMGPPGEQTFFLVAIR